MLRAGVCQLDDVLNNGIGGLAGLGLVVVGNKMLCATNSHGNRSDER